jgi:hypothetical protein
MGHQTLSNLIGIVFADFDSKKELFILFSRMVVSKKKKRLKNNCS